MKTSALIFSMVLLAACSSNTETNTVVEDQPVSDTIPEQSQELLSDDKLPDAKIADTKEVKEINVAEPEKTVQKQEKKIKSLKVALIGPKWKMTELLSKKVQKKPEPYYIHFEEENQFTAFAGCNHYNGSFKVKGSKITFSDVMGTKMACDDMKEETYLNEVLRTVDAYKIIDGELQLLEKGKIVAKFI